MNAKKVENNNFEQVFLSTTRRFDSPPEKDPIDLKLVWDGVNYIIKYINESKKSYSFSFGTYQDAFLCYKELCSRVVSDSELSGTES